MPRDAPVLGRPRLKLATRLALLFLTGAILLLALDGLFALRHDRQLFEADAVADAALLGTSLQVVVKDVWQRFGEDEALRLIADVDRGRRLFDIRWHWVESADAQPDAELSGSVLAELRAGRSVTLRRSQGLYAYLDSYFPVSLDDGRLGVLVVVESLAPIVEATRSSVMRLVVLTLALAVVAGVLAVTVGRRVVGRRLETLVEKTRRIGRGDFSGPVALPGRDELSELGASLNVMCERLEASRQSLYRETEARMAALAQLRHEDRLRTLGQLASGVAHELGTPLNVVQGRAGQIARRSLSADETQRAGETIAAQAQTMTGILRRMLEFARRQTPKKARVDVEVVVREAVDLLRPLADRAEVVLDVAREGEVGAILADGGQLRQVLTNLLMNAVQASEPGGVVQVAFGNRRARPPGSEPGESTYLRVAVSDQGSGIAEEDLPHLFEPFFTTKGVGEGTGLGLAIAQGIVEEHGGWIEVESGRGDGSCFSVFLPRG